MGGVWEAPWRLADDYHVYGFDWGKDELKFYVDGVLVRSVENTHWHQPLFLIFDSETMPEWFGMPDDKDLPSTFSVEYVRAWKRSEIAGPGSATLPLVPSGAKTDERRGDGENTGCPNGIGAVRQGRRAVRRNDEACASCGQAEAGVGRRDQAIRAIAANDRNQDGDDSASTRWST